MQILSMTTDTVHYYSVTYETVSTITPPTHSNHLPHTPYWYHTYL